jgi:hypothetical protein
MKVTNLFWYYLFCELTKAAYVVLTKVSYPIFPPTVPGTVGGSPARKGGLLEGGELLEGGVLLEDPRARRGGLLERGGLLREGDCWREKKVSEVF